MVGRGDGEHLSDRVHQKPEATTRALEDKNVLRALFGRQCQQLAQAYSGEHIAAVVHQPSDKGRSKRNRLWTRGANDLENVRDGYAKPGFGQTHRAYF